MDSSLGEASRRAETVCVQCRCRGGGLFQPGMKWKIAGLQGGKQRTEGGPDAGGGTAEAAADGAGDVVEATADGAGDDLVECVSPRTGGWQHALTWPVSVFIPPIAVHNGPASPHGSPVTGWVLGSVPRASHCSDTYCRLCPGHSRATPAPRGGGGRGGPSP